MDLKDIDPNDVDSVRRIVDRELTKRMREAMKPFDDAIEDLILNGADGMSPESRKVLAGSESARWCYNCYIGLHVVCLKGPRLTCECEQVEHVRLEIAPTARTSPTGSGIIA